MFENPAGEVCQRPAFLGGRGLNRRAQRRRHAQHDLRIGGLVVFHVERNKRGTINVNAPEFCRPLSAAAGSGSRCGRLRHILLRAGSAPSCQHILGIAPVDLALLGNQHRPRGIGDDHNRKPESLQMQIKTELAVALRPPHREQFAAVTRRQARFRIKS